MLRLYRRTGQHKKFIQTCVYGSPGSVFCNIMQSSNSALSSWKVGLDKIIEYFFGIRTTVKSHMHVVRCLVERVLSLQKQALILPAWIQWERLCEADYRQTKQLRDCALDHHLVKKVPFVEVKGHSTASSLDLLRTFVCIHVCAGNTFSQSIFGSEELRSIS